MCVPLQPISSALFCASSKDSSSSESVITEYLKNSQDEADIIILLQVTNPFIKKRHLDEAISNFLKHDFDSMFSAVKSNWFIWKKKNNLK